MPLKNGSPAPKSITAWTQASWNDPLYLLSRLGRQCTKMFAEALEDLQLKPRHVSVLRYVSLREGASQRDLVEGLWSDSSSVVSLLDYVTELGLAERRPNPNDRRAYALFLTKKGYQVLAEAEQISERVTQNFFSRLSEEQLDQLRELLQTVTATSPDDV
ncbi:MarR family winged helix-turn-helix transcriptional regulator [Pseudarthrobacter sp. GA104]|uniref:MarR family winged helix-turn-helix transcriptional regulator n=1 Tax=Pseudarthrobacter sp. GA104 TaxID=2676311 RepID=UPI0018D25804|nr:MarR family winged helix-turn-helix transcriptional regulator [Pseudarthrobacter sp. GA104]